MGRKKKAGGRERHADRFRRCRRAARGSALRLHMAGWAGQGRVGPLGNMTKDGPDLVNFAPGDPVAPTVAYGYYPSSGIADAAADQYRR